MEFIEEFRGIKNECKNIRTGRNWLIEHIEDKDGVIPYSFKISPENIWLKTADIKRKHLDKGFLKNYSGLEKVLSKFFTFSKN
ncbi:MAG TPA: hypothetical protein ENH90_01155 [bacterium]|nr:hypothetical protein [bacterium]